MLGVGHSVRRRDHMLATWIGLGWVVDDARVVRLQWYHVPEPGMAWMGGRVLVGRHPETTQTERVQFHNPSQHTRHDQATGNGLNTRNED